MFTLKFHMRNKLFFSPILNSKQTSETSLNQIEISATEYFAVEADVHLHRVELICVNSEATVSAGESTVAAAEKGTCAFACVLPPLHTNFLPDHRLLVIHRG